MFKRKWIKSYFLHEIEIGGGTIQFFYIYNIKSSQLFLDIDKESDVHVGIEKISKFFKIYWYFCFQDL